MNEFNEALSITSVSYHFFACFVFTDCIRNRELRINPIDGEDSSHAKYITVNTSCCHGITNSKYICHSISIQLLEWPVQNLFRQKEGLSMVAIWGK